MALHVGSPSLEGPVGEEGRIVGSDGRVKAPSAAWNTSFYF